MSRICTGSTKCRSYVGSDQETVNYCFFHSFRFGRFVLSSNIRMSVLLSKHSKSCVCHDLVIFRQLATTQSTGPPVHLCRLSVCPRNYLVESTHPRVTTRYKGNGDGRSGLICKMARSSLLLYTVLCTQLYMSFAYSEGDDMLLPNAVKSTMQVSSIKRIEYLEFRRSKRLATIIILETEKKVKISDLIILFCCFWTVLNNRKKKI